MKYSEPPMFFQHNQHLFMVFPIKTSNHLWYTIIHQQFMFIPPTSIFLEISFNFKHVRFALLHVYHTSFNVHITNNFLSAFISYHHKIISIFLSATSFILVKISPIQKKKKIIQKIYKTYIIYLFLYCTFRFPEWILNQYKQKVFGPQLFHISVQNLFFSQGRSVK